MTHKYILRNTSAVSIVLEYRFPSNRNYGFLHIGTSVSIPRNEGVKLSGILNFHKNPLSGTEENPSKI